MSVYNSSCWRFENLAANLVNVVLDNSSASRAADGCVGRGSALFRKGTCLPRKKKYLAFPHPFSFPSR